MDEVFRAADAEVEADKPQSKQEMVDEILADKEPEEKVEAKSEAEAEAEPTVKPEVELTPDDWKTRLPKIRKAVEAIPDPKMRRLLIDAYMTAQPYQRAGIRMSDIEHYKAVAPTPEVLDEIVMTADQMNNLKSAIAHGSDEAANHIMRMMVQVDPNGTRQFVSHIVDHLEEFHPPAWRAAGVKLIRNVVANMREDAKKGNPLLEEAARDLAVYVGLEAEESENSDQADLPEHARQKIEELELLKRQEAERRQLEMQARRDEVFQKIRTFHQGVISESFQEGAKVVQEWIDEYAGSYNDATKAKLFDSIGDELVRRVDQNPHIQAQYDKILRSGNGSPEHRAQARQYLINQARSLLPVVAAPVLREFSEIANGVRVKRQEKLTSASRRDLGSSGAAPITPRSQPLSGRGKTMDQVFAEFEAKQR